MATITIDPKLKNWLIYTQGKELYDKFLKLTMEDYKNSPQDRIITYISHAFTFPIEEIYFWWDLNHEYEKNTDPIPEYIEEDDNNKIYYEYNF